MFTFFIIVFFTCPSSEYMCLRLKQPIILSLQFILNKFIYIYVIPIFIVFSEINVYMSQMRCMSCNYFLCKKPNTFSVLEVHIHTHTYIHT